MVPEDDLPLAQGEWVESVPEIELEDPNQEFAIERVVSAIKVGRGWTLQVKWEGYPDTTPEPLWKILKQTNHPDVLGDIKKCKEDFYLQHPGARAADLLDFAGVNLMDTLDPVSVIDFDATTKYERRARDLLSLHAGY